MGLLECSISLSEKTFNENKEDVDWVWPPDGADCNKVFFFLFCVMKVLNGMYLTSVAITERRLGRPPEAQMEARAYKLTKRLMIGIVTCWFAELFFCILENVYGPDSPIIQNGQPVYPDLTPSKVGKTFWQNNYVVTADGHISNTFCMYRSWHMYEVSGNLVWFVALIVLNLYWMFTKERQRYLENVNKKRDKAAIKRLMEPRLQQWNETSPPPPHAAEDAEWIEWIRKSRVAMKALLDVLGDEEGGREAAKTAREGIYGMRSTEESQKPVSFEDAPLIPKQLRSFDVSVGFEE